MEAAGKGLFLKLTVFFLEGSSVKLLNNVWKRPAHVEY